MGSSSGDGSRRVKPYMVGSSGQHGRAAEKKLAKRLGAKLTPASGALSFEKSDMTLSDFRIESKATMKNSYRISLEDLLKVNQEALEKGGYPVFVIQFVAPSGDIRAGGSWAVVPEYVWKEMLCAKDEK